jgi:hypothetical protein
MRNPETMLRVYEELANRFAKQNEPRSRDHCLVLAADTALAAGRPQDADRLRQRLLQFNPHHLLRPFASMVESMQAPDVQEYVADLRRQWPPEFVQKLYLSGDNAPAVAEPPAAVPTRPTEVPQRTEPGVREVPKAAPPLPLREAKPPSPPVVEAPAPPRRVAALAAPAPPVSAAPPPRPARVAVSPVVPMPSPPAGMAGAWLATLVLLVGIAGGVGLFVLAFVWPLLESHAR